MRPAPAAWVGWCLVALSFALALAFTLGACAPKPVARNDHELKANWRGKITALPGVTNAKPGLANAFGKGTLFAAGLLFFPFVFLPMLGFGEAEYLE